MLCRRVPLTPHRCTARSDRAPDALVRERARLYAELEFAKWLVHGHDNDDARVVDDAVALLESLAANVAGSALITDTPVDVEGALALLGRVPQSRVEVDTSMQTDAYDPEQLSQWIADEDAAREGDDGADLAVAAGAVDVDPNATAPIEPLGAAASTSHPVPAPLAAASSDEVDAARGVSDAARGVSDVAAEGVSDAERGGSDDAERAGSDAERAVSDDAADAASDAERASDAALRRWLAD